MTPPSLSPAEWKVMRALWVEGPATVRQIKDALGADCDWAYSTVKTVLDRLSEKGAVEKGPAATGPGNTYRALVKEDDARRSAARALARSAFGGEVSDLMHFLVAEERLSAKDRARLRRLLAEEEGG